MVCHIHKVLKTTQVFLDLIRSIRPPRRDLFEKSVGLESHILTVRYPT